MVAFAKLEPGMVLYDCHREKMGNTTMSALGGVVSFVTAWDYVQEVCS